jgi:hypothetical protein
MMPESEVDTRIKPDMEKLSLLYLKAALMHTGLYP